MKTIKIICTAFAIGAVSLTANAQENRIDYNTYDTTTNSSNVYSAEAADDKHDRKSKFGVKGGANLSTLHIDDVRGENVKEGYHFGVYSKMHVAGPLSIQPELMYSRKGAEIQYDRNDVEGNIDYSLDYIDLPVLLRLDIGALNLHAGPYASYLIDAETKADDVRGGEQIEAELNEDAFQSFDYGLSGGLGLEWKALDMGVRYNYGMRDVGSQNRTDQNNLLQGGRNSVAQFYIGLGF